MREIAADGGRILRRRIPLGAGESDPCESHISGYDLRSWGKWDRRATMAVRLVVGAIGAVAAFVAAACWFYSATMAVPDNVDAIVEALKRIA